jgi:LPXTG-motif cell wall-anchored protein
MPVSYYIYGSVGVLLLTLLIGWFSRNKKK